MIEPLEFNGSLSLQEALPQIKEVVSEYKRIISEYDRIRSKYSGLRGIFKRNIAPTDQETLEKCLVDVDALPLSTQLCVRGQSEEVDRALEVLRDTPNPQAYIRTIKPELVKDILSYMVYQMVSQLEKQIVVYLGQFRNTGIRIYRLPVKYTMPKDPAILEMLGLGEGSELSEQRKIDMKKLERDGKIKFNKDD